ncbi:unnamed protein product [Soboliphyme baturini]|uniref:Transposase n=1 Tax=Soboliphyme baturini TaxID=241478 RepID=A0A183IA38_9BILA|nr:unnamed protein product [Soboliphyme baturini]
MERTLHRIKQAFAERRSHNVALLNDHLKFCLQQCGTAQYQALLQPDQQLKSRRLHDYLREAETARNRTLSQITPNSSPSKRTSSRNTRHYVTSTKSTARETNRHTLEWLNH